MEKGRRLEVAVSPELDIQIGMVFVLKPRYYDSETRILVIHDLTQGGQTIEEAEKSGDRTFGSWDLRIVSDENSPTTRWELKGFGGSHDRNDILSLLPIRFTKEQMKQLMYGFIGEERLHSPNEDTRKSVEAFVQLIDSRLDPMYDLHRKVK